MRMLTIEICSSQLEISAKTYLKDRVKYRDGNLREAIRYLGNVSRGLTCV